MSGEIAQKLGPSLKTVGDTLALHCYKSVERAGQRQNYFRNAGAMDWLRWYGKKYCYSSDYICSHPSEFSSSVAVLARMGNRSEELGEVLFRAAGCVSRLAGSSVPGALRALTGKGRFTQRLEKKLGLDSNAPKFEVSELNQLFDHLVKEGVFSIFGNSKLDLTQERFDGVLTTLAANTDVPAALKNLSNDQKKALCQAIVKADLRHLVSQRSFATKVAMAVGCGGLALAYMGAYTACKSLELGLAASFFLKLGMVSAVAYAMGFVFRSAATVLARATQAHSRCCRVGPPKPYLSIYDQAAKSLREFRNNNPITGRKFGHLAKANISKDDQHERMSMALLADDERAWVRYPAKFAKGLDVATDIMFSLDRVIGQGASRAAQHTLFRYEDNHSHEVGVSAQGKCNYSWEFKKGDKFRRSLASFVGRGGADTLGMALGCGACSALWTGLNMAVPAGAMFPVAAVAGVSGGMALGFASLAALGWGGAAAIDAGVQLGIKVAPKVAQLGESKGKTDQISVLDRNTNLSTQ